MRIVYKKWILLVALGMVSAISFAQNPFDLKSRLRGDTLVRDSVAVSDSQKQEVVPAKQTIEPTAPIVSPPERQTTDTPPPETPIQLDDQPSIIEQGQNWFASVFQRLDFFNGKLRLSLDQNVLFGITLFVLLMLACLMVLQRSMLYNAYRAVSNDNYLRFLLREFQNRPLIYRLYYIFFFINLGLFAFLSLVRLSGSIDSNLGLLPILFFTFLVIYGIRHLVLRILGNTFPVSKETELFGFILMLLNIVLGLVLTPVNIALSFGPPALYKPLIFLGLGVFIFLYLFRQMKGVFISGRVLSGYLFHFFLYFCIVEIAPLLVIGKLASSYLGVH